MADLDAVNVPPGWRGITDHEARYHAILASFGPALGVDMADPDRRIYAVDDIMSGSGFTFATVAPGQFMRFPKDHPRYKTQKRYKWREGPEGILFGTLTDEARADIEASRQPAAARFPAHLGRIEPAEDAKQTVPAEAAPAIEGRTAHAES